MLAGGRCVPPFGKPLSGMGPRGMASPKIDLREEPGARLPGRALRLQCRGFDGRGR